MIQTLMKNWWLIALSGIFYAIYSVMNFFMQGPDGSVALRTFVNNRGTLMDMGMLAVAAGVCTIAAGMWSWNAGKSWPLVLNGVACCALGLTLRGMFGSEIRFRTIALLIVVMAMSIGLHELATARTLRRHLAGGWLLSAAGIASVGFGAAFLAFALGWIKLENTRPLEGFLWFGSYFGFSAICMLGLALRAHKQPSH